MEYLQESLKMQRSLHGDRAHPGIAATLQKLGDLAAQNGDPKQGIKFLQESLQMQRSLHGDRAHPGIAATLHKLGDLAAQSGDLKQAMRFFQESLQIQRSLHGDHGHLGIARTLYKLGEVAMLRGDLQQAIDFLDLSLEIQRELHGDRAHPGIAVTLRKLGDVMAQTGDITEAMRHLLESSRVHRSLYGDKAHPNVADVLHSLGTANQRAGDFKQAEHFLEQSLRMKESLFTDKKHPSLRLTSSLLDQVRTTAQCLKKINASVLRLGELFEDECADTADTADGTPPHEFKFHSSVLSEASLIRLLAKKILKVHGAQPAADLEAQNRQTISKPEVTREVVFGWSTQICRTIAGLTEFMVAGTHSDTFQTACNDIIGQTFAIEDLLLDFMWATKEARKSEQDSIIQTFRKIREIALECESQVEEADICKETDAGKVLLETLSIRQLAEKSLDQYRAPLGERLKDLEEDTNSKVFGVIVDAAVKMVLLPGNNDSNYLQVAWDKHLVSLAHRAKIPVLVPPCKIFTALNKLADPWYPMILCWAASHFCGVRWFVELPRNHLEICKSSHFLAGEAETMDLSLDKTWVTRKFGTSDVERSENRWNLYEFIWIPEYFRSLLKSEWFLNSTYIGGGNQHPFASICELFWYYSPGYSYQAFDS